MVSVMEFMASGLLAVLVMFGGLALYGLLLGLLWLVWPPYRRRVRAEWAAREERLARFTRRD